MPKKLGALCKYMKSDADKDKCNDFVPLAKEMCLDKAKCRVKAVI